AVPVCGLLFVFSSRRRHTRFSRDWSSDVCSSDLGASASVALDAQHKFFRFNLPVSAHSDVLMQRMLASVAHTGDLFVIISYTGRTRELVEAATIARDNGASVLGLTAADSPLARVCTLSLHIPLPEDTDIYMPMTSRIVQLTVLDTLAAGVT